MLGQEKAVRRPTLVALLLSVVILGTTLSLQSLTSDAATLQLITVSSGLVVEKVAYGCQQTQEQALYDLSRSYQASLTTSHRLQAHFPQTNEDEPEDFAQENASQVLPSRGRRHSRPRLRVGRMLNLVSAAEQTPALALGSKSKYDFTNSVGDDESVAHTSWSAEAAAGVVAIAHIVYRRAIDCVDRCFKQGRAGSAQ
jgi:hypothetical protein